MKVLIFILFLSTGLVFGQTTYKSPFTQFLSSGGDVEEFDRTISIFPTEIKITSTQGNGKKIIQVLVIKDIIDFQKGDEPPIKTYDCISRDEKTLYQISIPLTLQVEQILLTQLDLSTMEAHDLRFLIDSQFLQDIKRSCLK